MTLIDNPVRTIDNMICTDPEEGTGGLDPPPPENHKNIGFLEYWSGSTVNNHKATKPEFNHCGAIISRPAKRVSLAR